MRPRYAWKPNMRWPIPVDVAVQRLRELRARHGKTSAAVVVRDAQHKSSPLHRCFNWDDTAAAERYRLMQARWLMTSIVVVTTEGPDLPPVRALVAVDIGNSMKDYIPLQLVMRDPSLRSQFLADALAEATRWMAKYQHLRELGDIFGAIRKVVEVGAESSVAVAE